MSMTKLDISGKEWRRALNRASAGMKIVIWAECGEEVVEAWACDTQAEAADLYDQLDAVGEVFTTYSGGVQ
jgi:hypothetical protein